MRPTRSSQYIRYINRALTGDLKLQEPLDLTVFGARKQPFGDRGRLTGVVERAVQGSAPLIPDADRADRLFESKAMGCDGDRERFRYERDVQAGFVELARFVGEILPQPSISHRGRQALMRVQDALVRLPFIVPGSALNLRILLPGDRRDLWCELDLTSVEIVLAVGGCHHDAFLGDDPYSTDLFYLARTGCRRADADGIHEWIHHARRLFNLGTATVSVLACGPGSGATL